MTTARNPHSQSTATASVRRPTRKDAQPRASAPRKVWSLTPPPPPQAHRNPRPDAPRNPLRTLPGSQAAPAPSKRVAHGSLIPAPLPAPVPHILPSDTNIGCGALLVAGIIALGVHSLEGLSPAAPALIFLISFFALVRPVPSSRELRVKARWLRHKLHNRQLASDVVARCAPLLQELLSQVSDIWDRWRSA
jgi:hypothetical protein